MVIHGMESTLEVPLDLMIMHGRAVMRGSSKALIVIDMPFGSYEESPAIAFRNASKIVKETVVAPLNSKEANEWAKPFII